MLNVFLASFTEVIIGNCVGICGIVAYRVMCVTVCVHDCVRVPVLWLFMKCTSLN